jgi:hypothetical protein
MKRITWEDMYAVTMGTVCLGSIVGGGTALAIGLAGNGIIWAGDNLKPHQRTLLLLQATGAITLAGGMVVTGGAIRIAQHLGDHAAEKEWQQRQQQQTSIAVASHVTPPACQGCRHFHGASYGGNFLVCGMHPYGWDGEKCPDFVLSQRAEKISNPTMDVFF